MNTIIKYEGLEKHFFIEAGQTIVLVNPKRLALLITSPHFAKLHYHYSSTLLAMDSEGYNLWTNKKVVNGRQIHPMRDSLYVFKNLEKDGAIFMEALPA